MYMIAYIYVQSLVEVLISVDSEENEKGGGAEGGGEGGDRGTGPMMMNQRGVSRILYMCICTIMYGVFRGILYSAASCIHVHVHVCT